MLHCTLPRHRIRIAIFHLNIKKDLGLAALFDGHRIFFAAKGSTEPFWLKENYFITNYYSVKIFGKLTVFQDEGDVGGAVALLLLCCCFGVTPIGAL